MLWWRGTLVVKSISMYVAGGLFPWDKDGEHTSTWSSARAANRYPGRIPMKLPRISFDIPNSEQAETLNRG